MKPYFYPATLPVMLIESQELPPIDTNSIALIEPDREECVIIDAPFNAYDWATKIAGHYNCKIIGLILTHGHWDHILDGHKFAKANIPIYGHKDDATMFAEPSHMANYAIPGLEMLPVRIDDWIRDGQILDLLGTEMEIRHVPGHCPGNILVYLARERVAIVGDVIFADSVGRYDLPGGDCKVLENSIKNQIYTLPDDTKIYPGHGSTTTVASEKATNPFVRG